MKFISKEIRKNRRKDRRERILQTAKEVEARVQKGDSRGAYQILRHWYRKRTKRTEKACEHDLDEIKVTYKELF